MRFLLTLALVSPCLVSCGGDASPAKQPAKPAVAAPFEKIHDSWDAILSEAVSEAGWVDYKALGGKLRGPFESYLGELAAADLEGRSADEKKAFWINAYNALCIQTLLDHELPAEVPHANVFGQNIFTEERYEVAGKVRSLDDIEHEILRKEFADPRIHAVVVCGASSCPRLRPKAFRAEGLSDQLDEEARTWMQRGVDKKGARKNRLDRANGTLYLSMILYWYSADFGEDDDAVLEFFKKHASDEDRAYLEANSVELEYLDYDWSINSR